MLQVYAQSQKSSDTQAILSEMMSEALQWEIRVYAFENMPVMKEHISAAELEEGKHERQQCIQKIIERTSTVEQLIAICNFANIVEMASIQKAMNLKWELIGFKDDVEALINRVIKQLLKSKPNFLKTMKLPPFRERVRLLPKLLNYMDDEDPQGEILSIRMYEGIKSLDDIKFFAENTPSAFIDILNDIITFKNVLNTVKSLTDLLELVKMIHACQKVSDKAEIERTAGIVTLLEHNPAFIEELSRQKGKQLFQNINNIVTVDPSAIFILLKHPKIRNCIAIQATKQWLLLHCYEPLPPKTRLTFQRQSSNSILVFTHCPKGMGDFRGAEKFIRAIAGQVDITWVIRNLHVTHALKDELADIPRLSIHEFHPEGSEAEAAGAAAAAVPQGFPDDALKHAQMCFALPASPRLVLLTEKVDKLNPGCPIHIMPENGFSISDIKIPTNGTHSLTTGVRPSDLGLFIDDKADVDFKHPVFNFLFGDKTLAAYADDRKLYFGYASKESETEFIPTYIATVLKLEAEDMTCHFVDIIIPNTQETKALLQQANFLEKHGISRVEFYSNDYILEDTQDSDVNNGKIIRVIDAFPLPKPVFNACLKVSQEFNLGTGDQSWAEMLCGTKTCIPLYQIRTWKINYFNHHIELAAQLNLKRVRNFFVTNQLSQFGLEKQSELLLALLRDKELKDEFTDYRNYLRQHKNLTRKLPRLLAQLLAHDQSIKQLVIQGRDQVGKNTLNIYRPKVPFVMTNVADEPSDTASASDDNNKQSVQQSREIIDWFRHEIMPKLKGFSPIESNQQSASQAANIAKLGALSSSASDSESAAPKRTNNRGRSGRGHRRRR